MKRIAALLASSLALSAQAEDDVRITHELPFVEVPVKGTIVRIERNPDPFNMIDPDFALTSRRCPPFCVQPMHLAPGVETIGELELLDYLKRATAEDADVMVVDSRDGTWPARSGIIPGAVVIPWQELFLEKGDQEHIATVLEDQFGVRRDGPLWSFAQAKTLVFYCNGPWCGQSPTNIKSLLAVGYPAHKLKWYRGGMQAWKALGLTTIPP